MFFSAPHPRRHVLLSMKHMCCVASITCTSAENVNISYLPTHVSDSGKKHLTSELCFFLLFTGYIFSSCLRVAYALPTPLRCFPTRGLFVLICLRVPTLTSCFLILPTRLACVASVGFLLVLILHILPTRWAPMIESTSNILWKHKTCTNQNARMWNPTSHITTTKHNFQFPISQQNTSSNTAYAEENINQHPQNASEKPTRASEMPTPALHKTYFV